MTNLRLLLVEDDPQLQRTFRRQLTAMGYEVTLVGTADEALSALEDPHFCVVLTDLTLEEERAGGLRVVLRCAEARVPVVLMSGDFTAADGPLPERRLEKPFAVAELRAMLEQALK